MRSLLPILLVTSSRLRRLFVQCRARRALRPIRHGEEKLSPAYSSIARAGAARLIPMPWNWIFPLMARIPLGRILTML